MDAATLSFEMLSRNSATVDSLKATGLASAANIARLTHADRDSSLFSSGAPLFIFSAG
jgi:hypothetical protein